MAERKQEHKNLHGSIVCLRLWKRNDPSIIWMIVNSIPRDIKIVFIRNPMSIYIYNIIHVPYGGSSIHFAPLEHIFPLLHMSHIQQYELY